MSAFQNAIAFFVNLGVYDVVLPFLLVFTIVYAMLEKTKILGINEAGKTQKNLNAMVGFVVGFLVIASTELVRVINTVLADVVLLLLLSIMFMLLAGSFHSAGEYSLKGGWNTMFMVLMFIGVVLIFLNALGWLEMVWRYLNGHLDGPVVGSFMMLVVVIAGMYFIIGGKSGDGNANKGENKG